MFSPETDVAIRDKDGWRWALLVAATGVAVALALRFVQDDAFISFRYARNLAEGLGLVWNPGERVEGYTNFLWTVLMAPSFWLGVDVVIWSWTLSIACFATVLILICRWKGAGAFARSAAAGLLIANYSLASYATGGLETQLVVAGVVSSVWFLDRGRFVPAALSATAAVLSRMDSVLLLAPFWFAAVFPRGFRLDFREFRAAPLLAGFFATGVPVGAWLLWRHSYYGFWVPNTFLVKGVASPLRGLLYVAIFVAIYGWFLPPEAALVTRKGREDGLEILKSHPAMFCAVVLHLAYVVLVGGDFMEFRLIVPCAPFAALLFADFLSGRRWLLAVLLALGPIGAPLLKPPYIAQSIPTLREFSTHWTEEAVALTEILGEDGRDVRIALTPAGTIPFHTGLYTLDQLGLNSREVALHGDRIPPGVPLLGNLPGHSVLATWEQIQGRGIHLVINHPWVVQRPVEEALPLDPQGRVRREAFNAVFPSFHVDIPAESGAQVIAWPVGEKWWIMVLSETCEAIERAAARSGAKRFDFDS